MKRRKSTRRNLHTSSSRRKKNTIYTDLNDRISSLPDSILGLILSHLPTKNAVATSILSKRWKFVWMTVHNLDFCLDGWNDYVHEDKVMEFVRFVNRVLLLHDGGLLNKFRLLWREWCIPSEISSWINTAITRNVHDLSLCFWASQRHLQPSFEHEIKLLEMPASVFIADSLRCLELNGNISVPSEIVVCLPRLESLKLDSVYFQSEDAFKKLISGCPKLDYLLIDVDNYYLARYLQDSGDFTFIISSSSLRRLELLVDLSKYRATLCLELEASSLEYLKIFGPVSKVIVKGCLSSLVEADFRIHMHEDEYIEDNYDPHVEAVHAFDCAKTLSADAMWVLSHGKICLSTKFSRLTKLEAGVVFCYCSSLLEVIQSSDSLKVLTIYQEPTNLGEYDHDSSTWIALVEVPKCLSKSLKEVSIEGYVGYADEREMIGYMLTHGSVLEVLHVTCDTYKKDECLELHKEICRFPKKSMACKVEFVELTNWVIYRKRPTKTRF